MFTAMMIVKSEYRTRLNFLAVSSASIATSNMIRIAQTAFRITASILQSVVDLSNEVMCAGVPVVVADEVGCVANLVRDGENGLVMQAGNVD